MPPARAGAHAPISDAHTPSAGHPPPPGCAALEFLLASQSAGIYIRSNARWSVRKGGEMTPIISYLRVSTAQQGRSGLGIEAQREANARFAAEHGLTIEDEYVERSEGHRLNSHH